jgi:hypothetical protein
MMNEKRKQTQDSYREEEQSRNLPSVSDKYLDRSSFDEEAE